jgi:hypothetical protein
VYFSETLTVSELCRVFSRKVRQGTEPTGCGYRSSLQIWRVATCLLSKQLWIVGSECSSSLRTGRGSSKPICYDRLHDVTFEISKNRELLENYQLLKKEWYAKVICSASFKVTDSKNKCSCLAFLCRKLTNF